ncbi:unnamed protein product [Cuscuta campestris]|uniref:Uncharacterized protein n=1 Tax=Cuscuta campestris TaxID=132261 RepID=A0A484N347_9ASTE|nr:unnamed protein product [Cuscuta campestris]
MEGLSFEDQKAQRFGSDPPFSQTKDVPPADMPFSFKHDAGSYNTMISPSEILDAEIASNPIYRAICVATCEKQLEDLKPRLEELPKGLPCFRAKLHEEYEKAMKALESKDRASTITHFKKVDYWAEKAVHVFDTLECVKISIRVCTDDLEKYKSEFQEDKRRKTELDVIQSG